MARLGDYIEQIRGVSYKPEDVCTAQDKDAVAILRANNIQDDGLNFDDLIYVKQSKISSAQYIKSGDIVVCASSGSKHLVGKAAIAHDDMRISFGAFCKVVRPQKMLPSYVGHYFQSPKYRNKISELAGGANINNIRNEHIDELDIVVPNIDEQERIAIELNKVCGLISLRKEQLAKLDQLVKSRFIEMFGDKDCPKCDVVKLSSLVKYQQGTQVDIEKQSTTCAAGMKRFLRIIDYTQGNQEPRYVENRGTYVEEDTVCIVRYGTVGFVCKGYNGILANNLFKLDITSPNIDNDFLYCVLKYGTFENDIKALSNGATMPALSFKIMDTIDILLPSVEKQKEYVAFVEQTDKSELAIQQSLEQLETLKKSLMQKYFG